MAQANVLFDSKSQKYNTASIMCRAHSMVAEQRATWPKLYKGRSYAQILASCLSAAWQEARLEKSVPATSATVQINELSAQVFILRNRETSRINHQAKIAELDREIAQLHLEAA